MTDKINKKELFWTLLFIIFGYICLLTIPFALAEEDENINLLQAIYFGTIGFFSSILKPLLVFVLLIVVVLIVILIGFFIKRMADAIRRLG
jgi:hypothetical protein